MQGKTLISTYTLAYQYIFIFLIIYVDCFTFTQLTAVKPKMLPTSFTQGQNVVFLIIYIFFKSSSPLFTSFQFVWFILLLQISDASGSMKTSVVAQTSPFKQEMLSLEECYILDNGVDKNVFVWKGVSLNNFKINMKSKSNLFSCLINIPGLIVYRSLVHIIPKKTSESI